MTAKINYDKDGFILNEFSVHSGPAEDYSVL
jgi:hypothetical protein